MELYPLFSGNVSGILPVILALIHALGILTALDALYNARTAQAALAWSLSLIMFPYAMLPIYWTFGRRRFSGYRETLKRFVASNRKAYEAHQKRLREFYADRVPIETTSENAFEAIARSEFTGKNQVTYLRNGEETFPAMFAEFEKAQHYILVSSYIIRDDRAGREFLTSFIAQARRGVRCYLLYDEIGCARLSTRYIRELENAGVVIAPFYTRQGWGNFFQFNFRNHRKIVVVDGAVAFVGGINIADEYCGRIRRYGKWRDAQARIEGPAAVEVQQTFASDWLWATQAALDLRWAPIDGSGHMSVLPIASGPSDEKERCILMFLEAIKSARKRLWIATPYFVPDDSIVYALQLAVLRGVDVRLLMPKKADHYLVWLASFLYLPEIRKVGGRVFKYTPGFLHQKTFLVDDTLVGIGSANLDNRSLRLNFEITALVASKEFAETNARIFEQDFAESEEERYESFSDLPWTLRFGAKFARLFSPVL